MKESFEYKLIQPIKIAAEGKEVTEDTVTVMCPRPRDKHDLAILNAYIGKAITEFQITRSRIETPSKATINPKQEQNDEDEADLTDDELANSYEQFVINNIPPEDINKVYLCFSDILCAGNTEKPQAKIGNKKFTKPLWDELGFHDTKALLARYALNFLSLGMV